MMQTQNVVMSDTQAGYHPLLTDATLVPRSSAGLSAALNQSGSPLNRGFGVGADLRLLLNAGNIGALLSLFESGNQRVEKRLEAAKEVDAAEKSARLIEMRKFYNAMVALAEAQKSGLLSKITGWILKAVALIASTSMIVATAGTASPLAVGLMATALMLSLYDIASSAAMEANGDLKIGLEAGCGKALGAVAKACGADEEKVKQIEQWGGMALSLVIQLGVSFGACGALIPKQASNGLDASRQALQKVGELFSSIGTFPGKLIGNAFVRLGDKLDRPMLEQLGRVIQPSASFGQPVRSGSAVADDAAAAAPGLEESLNAVRREASRLERLTTKLAVYANIAHAGTTAVHSSLSIVSGVDSYKADVLEADRMRSEAALDFIKAINEADMKDIEIMMEQLEEVLKAAYSIRQKDDEFIKKFSAADRYA